jgi:hypothetical protein
MPRKGTLKTQSESQQRRAKYLVTFLRTRSDKQARHASGLSEQAHRRIIKMLEEHGTILDAPRSGRPRLYTKALLGKAVEMLVENKAELLTGHMLLELMVSMGLVRESVDVGTFMKNSADLSHLLASSLW